MPEDKRFDSQPGRIFLTATMYRLAFGHTQPPTQWALVLSLAVRQLGRQAKHSSPPSAEVKTAQSYTSTPTRVRGAMLSYASAATFTLLYFTLFPVIP
jgi:hypothetical protein